MRPDKLRRKLILNAETLRALDDHQLGGIAGGVGSQILTCPTADKKCPSVYTPDCLSYNATECRFQGC